VMRSPKHSTGFAGSVENEKPSFTGAATIRFLAS